MAMYRKFILLFLATGTLCSCGVALVGLELAKQSITDRSIKQSNKFDRVRSNLDSTIIDRADTNLARASDVEPVDITKDMNESDKQNQDNKPFTWDWLKGDIICGAVWEGKDIYYPAEDYYFINVNHPEYKVRVVKDGDDEQHNVAYLNDSVVYITNSGDVPNKSLVHQIVIEDFSNNKYNVNSTPAVKYYVNSILNGDDSNLQFKVLSYDLGLRLAAYSTVSNAKKKEALAKWKKTSEDSAKEIQKRYANPNYIKAKNYIKQLEEDHSNIEWITKRIDVTTINYCSSDSVYSYNMILSIKDKSINFKFEKDSRK